MPPFKKRKSTTRLPVALQEELGINLRNPSRRKPTHSNKRKGIDLRKRPDTPNKRVRTSVPAVDSAKALNKTLPDAPSSSKAAETPLQRLLQKQAGPSRDEQDGRPDRKGKKTRRQLATVEQEEEDEIAWLEYKLGISGKKKGKKKVEDDVEDDGLDDLLEDLDRFAPDAWNVDGGTDGAETDDSASEEEVLSDDDEASETGNSESGDEAGEDSEIASSEGEAEDASKDGESEVGSEGTGHSDAGEEEAGVEEKSLTRVADDEPVNSEELTRLKRQTQGLLNRLGESNMDSILSEIEKLYRSHRRHDVTVSVVDIVLEAVSSRSSLLDAFVILHAAFIAGLHKILGVEFAARFVQTLVALFEANYKKLQAPKLDETRTAEEDTEPTGSKECMNLIVLISELYNFQVVSCILIYDMVKKLLDSELTEPDVEILLKVIRASGQQLRHDDPSSLKEIVDLVQVKVKALDQTKINSRTRFMIEMMNDLKNNRIKAIGGRQSAVEATARVKKFLSGLEKRHTVKAHEPLRISLEDLRTASTKGKWWLVGAAWKGHGDSSAPENAPENVGTAKVVKEHSDDALLRLARAQGMNTDIRRSIFVVLMSSEDYVHASQRLLQLKLSDVQRREIIRVLLHCCGNEKVYNPYYALVGHQLCDHSHAFRVTLQYCLWDFLRELGESDAGGLELQKSLGASGVADGSHVSFPRLKNTARAYSWWIAKGSLSLTVLKTLNFLELQQKTISFLRRLLAHLLLDLQPLSAGSRPIGSQKAREAIERLFVKVVGNPSLTHGLLYFTQTTLRDEDAGQDHSSQKALAWGKEVVKETLKVGSSVAKDL